MRTLLMTLGFLALVNALWIALLVFVNYREDQSAAQHGYIQQSAPDN